PAADAYDLVPVVQQDARRHPPRAERDGVVEDEADRVRDQVGDVLDAIDQRPLRVRARPRRAPGMWGFALERGPDRLGLEVGLEALVAVLTADSGRLVAAERRARVG